jgi:hypothetical protein
MEDQRADPMFTTLLEPRFRLCSRVPVSGPENPEDTMNPVPLLAALAVKALLKWLMSDD